MEIRPARADESDQLASLYIEARRAAVPAVPPLVHDDDDVRQWWRTVVLPTREVWVARDDRVLALLVLEADTIDQLYVHPDVTGQGIGTRLLALAKQLRPHGLELWTFQSNLGGRRFYERHGFCAVETTDGDNEERAPDVRYVWSGATTSGP